MLYCNCVWEDCPVSGSLGDDLPGCLIRTNPVARAIQMTGPPLMGESVA